MAVLCEAFSVIIRCDVAVQVLGSLEGLTNLTTNKTLCCDDEVARVGFRSSDDVRSFISHLEGLGFRRDTDGKAADFVVVDQQKGCMTACDWLEVGRVGVGGGEVTLARLTGSEKGKILFVPEGWKFEGSLSQMHDFVPSKATM
jgi:hypothetical protein